MPTKTKPTKVSKELAAEIVREKSAWGDRLTVVAFFMALALVIARATMMEILRDPDAAIPGVQMAPRGAGAVTILVLNLLCCVPALLVLCRRAFDKTYFIRFAWSFVPMLLLGAWAMLSALWAADKFAAIIGGCTWLSAAVLLWSMSQLVRSWLRLRAVLGTCCGLLLVFIAVGVTYEFMDLVDMKHNWPEMRAKVFEQHGWKETDFAARQFEKKILNGDLAGFEASPNTFAAIIMFCCVITAGLIIQRLRDGVDATGAVIPIIVILLGFWMIYYTSSRTAFATPVIAAMILVATWRLGPWLRAHAKRAYWIGAACVILGTVAVVGHGLTHHSLVHVSLTFRWRYWVGAARLLAANKIFGVGWDNFGLFYPSARLAEAAEEVKDPHNFVVRAFAELGIVGGALMLAWLGRLWWELTRPVEPSANVAKRACPANAVAYFTLLALVAFVVNALASIDFSQEGAYVTFELLKRVLWILLLILGALSVTLVSLQRQHFDDRPAPWALYGAIAAIAVFFVHNLIDFSMFENGPMFLFAMVVGAALGVRLPNPESAPARRGSAIVMLAIGLLAWIGVLVGLLLPTMDAEDHANKGDVAIRTRQLFVASQEFDAAFKAMPINPDYAFRSARALIMREAPSGDVRARLAQAIAGNPMRAEYFLTRARYEQLRPPSDQDYMRVQEDFDSASRIDPHDVQLHLEFARAIELDDKTVALKHLREALRDNDLLPSDEPKRLSPEEIDKIQQKIKVLEEPRMPASAPSKK